ncbi:unnamed protein product [Prorocentrum cordatum]|uniref:Uncharacterized protein n=1 Tax=Prorocentrum cordatum TaxID=2364126 RepID=A0ABN9V3W5_9DINO|nr:unnamed protein product [Polarella glacialis]
MSKLHAHFIRAAASKDAWKQATLGELRGVVAGSPAQGVRSLAWAHGLGGSCAADDARGVAGMLYAAGGPGHTLRVDLRGHGRSQGAAGACDAELHAWPAAGAALRAAAHAGGARRAVFGGEAAGAFAALQAVVGAPEPAHAAAAGLILMRPPTIWGEREVWRRRYETAAGWVEKDGFEGKDVQWEAKLRLTAASYAGKLSKQEREVILGEWRAMGAPAYAAALRGLAASELPCDSVLRGGGGPCGHHSWGQAGGGAELPGCLRDLAPAHQGDARLVGCRLIGPWSAVLPERGCTNSGGVATIWVEELE